MKNAVRIYILHYGECDPKKCTGKKMKRMGFGTIVRDFKQVPRGVVLNPFSKIALSKADREVAVKRGLIVVDASWAKLKYGKFPMGTQRSLPFLIAANPINFGKPAKLSSLEATVAALYIMDFKALALKLASIFKWGIVFVNMNKDYLEAYSQAENSSEVIELQRRFILQL